MQSNLINLDAITKDLFLESFTEDGKRLIKTAQEVGDYEYNE